MDSPEPDTPFAAVSAQTTRAGMVSSLAPVRLQAAGKELEPICAGHSERGGRYFFKHTG